MTKGLSEDKEVDQKEEALQKSKKIKLIKFQGQKSTTMLNVHMIREQVRTEMKRGPHNLTIKNSVVTWIVQFQ